MKWIFAVLIATTVVGHKARPQETISPPKTNQSVVKTMNTVGTVSGDEKLFVDSEDNKNWMVTNPEVLKGHGGQLVKIKGEAHEGKGEMRVLSLKVFHPKVVPARR